jgi:protein involved in polysaccharide export with SLBB domain
MAMNGWSCSTKTNAPRPPQTFFLTLQGLSKVAGFISILTLLVFAGAGCQTDTNTTTFSGQAEVPRHVILASGDVVKLTFSAAPELNQSQKVRADGKLSLPLVGEVDAAGKTVGQLQGELVELYKPQLKTPEVTVSLEASLTTVVVSGAVNKPAKIAFERPTTVFQAIMEAGGPSEFGTLKHVRLIRTVNGVQRSQVMNVHDTLLGQGTKPFYVRDGDVIYVPQTAF